MFSNLIDDEQQADDVDDSELKRVFALLDLQGNLLLRHSSTKTIH
jgi:hypothetical protein